MRAKVDVNTANESGDTLAHYAAYDGHHGVVEVLVRAQADVNTANESGLMPAHYAAALPWYLVVK